EIGRVVSVIDVKRNAVIEAIKIERPRAKPKGVVVRPDGKRVYVATGGGHEVAVIDTATNKVLTYIKVGRRPWGLGITRDGSYLLTANGVSNDVSVIDTATDTVIATIPVGKGPWGVAIGP
ncbi:MAG: PQQ-dependent catabolism-associated beta-propeller protein, partial [Candidatus Methylomirabilales bacterium]